MGRRFMCLFSIGVTRKNRVEILLETLYYLGRPLAGGDFQSMADGDLPLPPALVQRIDRLHRP